jgi:hypothetical protein
MWNRRERGQRGKGERQADGLPRRAVLSLRKVMAAFLGCEESSLNGSIQLTRGTTRGLLSLEAH